MHPTSFFHLSLQRHSIYSCDPLLIGVTCLRLAVKFCENSFAGDFTDFFQKRVLGDTYLTYSNVTLMEYVVLPEIEFDLIVYVPSRPLLQFVLYLTNDLSLVLH